MVSVETYLLRGKRRMETIFSIGWLGTLGRGIAWAGSGFLLSGASLWGTMQPGAMALVLCSTGWRCICAAMGSGAGYLLFWGSGGIQGAVWCLGALLLAILAPFFGDGVTLQRKLALSGACLVSASGLVYPLRFPHPVPVPLFFVRVVLAWMAAHLGFRLRDGDRAARWACMALGVCVLCQMPVPIWCNPGLLAAGLLAAAAPLPAAAMAGIGADLTRVPAVPMSAVVGLSFFFRHLPVRGRGMRTAAPGMACLVMMAVLRQWDPGMLLASALGGAAGALLPWQIGAIPRHAWVSAAQVQLEQNARVLSFLQRQLLEYPPSPPEGALLLDRLKQERCLPCRYRENCREQDRLCAAVLTRGEAFACRRGEAMAASIERCRDQWKRMLALQASREEYRAALVQQYGFLADALRDLADTLHSREERAVPRFRVLVSARSRGKHWANGDSVTAFPGLRCRYYVLLCDGMGTGLGAAEEGRQTAQLLKQMLSAGRSPASALGSINSQLTLLNRGGAVTVDLTEVQLDSGCTWVYKWGAEPGWLLRRGKAEKIGYATPPPGTSLESGRESTGRVSLARGETLLMVSDGISSTNASSWAADAEHTEPGDLAQRILGEGSQGEDDATAVVIRLTRTQL